MFPIEFDARILSSLPLPDDAGKKRVLDIMNSVITRQVAPHFRNKKGTDLFQLARIKQGLSIYRLEDEDNRVRLVSVVSSSDQKWHLGVHERIFDYMVFVIPTRTELATGGEAAEERKITVFLEFMLNHEVEHMLDFERSQHSLIRSDVDLAMDWRQRDPQKYRMLRSVLSDEMNGILGNSYLNLFDLAEKGQPLDANVSDMANAYGAAVASLPDALLEGVFPHLDTAVRAKVLGDWFRISKSTSFTIIQRALSLQKLVRFFNLMLGESKERTARVFDAFKDRWGAVSLLYELGAPESRVDGKSGEELFQLLVKAVGRFEADNKSKPIKAEVIAPAIAHAPSESRRLLEPKSLKERIEEARSDPFFSQQAMELIDKNKMNAAGQSGAKYTEFIETLLAIPWGKIKKIDVSPAEFEDGLNRSHYGLHKPKEIVCDIFSNLIWRYQRFGEKERGSWRHTGSALLFVGPPGVGKTSLAISIAKNLGIPCHKISLGGMKDEADIRGYGFTYEGSKPGPIIQGLIKMGVMNGMFILDEVDKTEKIAVSTLLEILDPEQNHLFHDKYTQSTVDIDVSNCHFILTANSLESVPPPVLNRCEVVFVDRYSVEEKIDIARKHLIGRVREKYEIKDEEIYFDPLYEAEVLRYLIKNFTLEAGVRELERILRTLFLRIHRKEILSLDKDSAPITMERIRKYLDEPSLARMINPDDRVGEMMGLGVNAELGIGSLIPIQVTSVRLSGEEGAHGLSVAHTTGNIEKIMDESRKVALTAISNCAESLGIDAERVKDPVHLHFMGGSTRKDGPSAGGSIALALASFLLDKKIRRDVAMTGEIDTKGRITGIGGLGVKIETAYTAGCKTVIIPKENLYGNEGIDRLPDSLKKELQMLTYEEWRKPHAPFDYRSQVLQVIAVDHITQAADIAFIDERELRNLEDEFMFNACLAHDDIAGMDELPRRLRVLYLDNPEELDLDFLEAGICRDEPGCILLTPDDVYEALAYKLKNFDGGVTIRSFNPDRESLSEVVRKIQSSASEYTVFPVGISLTAPLFLLREDGIGRDVEKSTLEGPRIFATSCTAENVKIRDCRKILGRVYHYLSFVQQAVLDECPFLSLRDGVYEVDMSFIPEKYRIDTDRAQEILHECLTQWLRLVGTLELIVEDGDAVPLREMSTAGAN